MNHPPGLTPEQHRQLESDGYFVVKQALSPAEVERLTVAADAMFDRQSDAETNLRDEQPGQAPTEDRSGILGNVIEKSDELIPLLDHPSTFPLVLDLLGPYIILGLSESTRKKPCTETGDQTGFIHSDGGHSLSRIRVTDNSRALQLKTHYFLTDCLAPDMGNFAVVPGSHRSTPHWATGEATTPTEVEAVPVLMQAGDCAMWTHPLWHGAMPNRSAVTRKTITFAYNQMFIRALANPPSERLLAKCTLRQRRLLGDFGADAHGQTWGPQFHFFYAPPGYAEIMLGG